MEKIANSRERWITLIIMAAVWICAACTPVSGPEIRATGAWVRAVDIQQGNSGDAASTMATMMPGMSGATSAVYLTLQNTGSQADSLVSVSSDAAQSVEIHQTQMQNNVASMQKVDRLDLPAKSSVQLQPGGYHLMLIGVNRSLVAGGKITLNLQFEKSTPIQVEAEVRGP